MSRAAFLAVGGGTGRKLGLTAFMVGVVATLAVAAPDVLNEILEMEQSGAVVTSAAGPGSFTQRPSVPTVEQLEAELAAARIENESLRGELATISSTHAREMHLAHYNMGCIYRAIKDFRRAEEQFLKALVTNEEDPAVHFNLGILYDDDLGDKVRAKKHYLRFLQLAPDDRDAPQVREWLSLMP